MPVTIGIETRSQIEILSGLSEGDQVVVGNTSQFGRVRSSLRNRWNCPRHGGGN